MKDCDHEIEWENWCWNGLASKTFHEEYRRGFCSKCKQSFKEIQTNIIEEVIKT